LSLTQTDADTHRANADTAIEVVKAMAAGDLPRLLEIWSPKFRLHSPQSAGPLVGGREWPDTPDPYRELEDYIPAYENARSRLFADGNGEPPEFLHVAADGDVVIPLVVIRDRFRDGTPYANVYCFPMVFEDGKVVEMWEVLDTGYAYPLFRQQLSNDAE
jgi:ketosteroid isomerase-like protein